MGPEELCKVQPVNRSCRVVGLYSPAPRSGKGTVAAVFERWDWRTLRFSDPIREMFFALMHKAANATATSRLFEEGKEDPIPALEGMSYRDFAVTLGTEWGRKNWPDLWVNIARRRAQATLDAGSYRGVLFEDLRFRNELEMIWDLGGVVIEVTRPTWNGGRPVVTSSSENLLPVSASDYRIRNVGTLDFLRYEAEQIIHVLGTGDPIFSLQ